VRNRSDFERQNESEIVPIVERQCRCKDGLSRTLSAGDPLVKEEIDRFKLHRVEVLEREQI
ncbi:MAG: hypothetical protein ACYCOU_05885, partial [Sulfobacillus sp.]